jgi:predicted dehydrogenase
MPRRAFPPGSLPGGTCDRIDPGGDTGVARRGAFNQARCDASERVAFHHGGGVIRAVLLLMHPIPVASPAASSRREFLKTASRLSAVGITAPNILPSGAFAAAGRPGANGKIQVGLIGCNGMGRSNAGNVAKHADVVVTAACDVSRSRREALAKQFKDSCRAYGDFRELLAQPSVDAVIIASPPHWHTLMAVAAMEAGKDVYLQKPMTLTLGEDLVVRNAVKRTGRVCQIGTQIHASENYRRVVEMIRAGYLGKIGAVRTFNVMNQGVKGVGRQAPGTAAPADLDWDFWCGPAPLIPFNAILYSGSYNHGSWMAYSGGWTPGMAPHILDLPVWALDLQYPTEVSSSGGRFIIDDDGDAYDNHEVLWRYPGMTMTWMSSLTNSYGFDWHGRPVPERRLGIYFHGVLGTMWSNYNEHRIVPEGKTMNDFLKPEAIAKKQAPDYPVRALYNIADVKPVAERIPPSPGQEFEWIECIKTRRQPSCTPEYHSRINVPIVLSLLSLKLGRTIRFAPKTQQIVGDREAEKLAVPEYRAPWKFPAHYLTA